MVIVREFAGRRVGVLGLARSGRAAVEALNAGGATVLAWDDSEKVRAAVDFPLTDAAGWHDLAVLVVSPGIPTTFPKPHPAVIRAREAGTPIIGDLELLYRAQPASRFIGITGTNGKSTTTALIGHILREAGLPTEIGGNLGTAALSLAPLGAGGSYVLEASSYQLELLATMAFDIGVLLNVTPDHLDRHGGMDGYIAAKEHIFDRQDANSTAVIGVDDEICAAMAERLRQGPRRVVPVSINGAVGGGVYVENGRLVDAIDGAPQPVLDLAKAERLPGAHNWQNACAAYAVARRVGLSPEAVSAKILSFPGLAHRQELVDTIDGVRYINDSKATNADASEKALICYRAIYWIAGGLPKAGGITALAPYFGRLRHTFLIGNATEEFAATLDDGKSPYTRCGDLATALAAADRMARAEHVAGAVVLLSPACASFDQFTDFEARGDRFRDLVAALPRR